MQMLFETDRLRRTAQAGMRGAAVAATLALALAAGLDPAGAAGTDCGPTAPSVEGPYYVSGMPEITDGNLNASGLAGTPLLLTGRVLGGAGDGTPIAGAEVEIWQTDDAGEYHPNGNGPASRYEASELALRGFVRTDTEGRYRVATIYPGRYPGRVRHLHLKIRAPGRPELTTQLVLPPLSGDEKGRDGIARRLPKCQHLQVEQRNGGLEASYDFRL